MKREFKKNSLSRSRYRKAGMKKLVSIVLSTAMILGLAPQLPQLAIGDEVNLGVTETQALTADQLRAKVVEIALAEEGYHEKASGDSRYLYTKNQNNGSKNYTKYCQDLKNHPGGSDWAWCAFFVSWCMKQAGVPVTVYNWASPNCGWAGIYTNPQNKDYIKSGTVYTYFDSSKIQAGDVVFFEWGHAGLIYKVEGNQYYTIEGNSGSTDAVYKYTYQRGGVKYFVHIDYTGQSGPVYFSNPGSTGGTVSALANPDDHTVPTRNLYYRSSMMSGDDVAWVQAMCNKLIGKNLSIDGKFGTGTRDAVKEFQRANGLSVDGIVGTNTINKMKQLWESKKVVNPTSISLSANSIQSTIGYTDKLTASVGPANATDKSVAWSSSNTSVATVYDGTIKGVGVGEATITAKTSNGISASCKVYVHKENTITFVKDDGTVLSVQKVKYGGSAKAPMNVTKTGYTFSSWEGTYQNVTDDATVTAVFTKNKYKVTFAETDGTKIGTVQTVAYDEAATAPSENDLHIPEGYKLKGWSESFDHVTSDMTIYPIYTWGDEELPLAISASEDSCVANSSKGIYVLNFGIINHTDVDRKARVMTYMITNSGKLVAQGETRTVIVPAAKDGELQIKDMYVACPETANKVRVVVLDDYESAVPLAEIKDISVYLAGYGQWSDAVPAAGEEYQTRTLYHSKNVSYTTSSAASLSGWTKYNTKSTTTSTRMNDRIWFGCGSGASAPGRSGTYRTWSEPRSNAYLNPGDYTYPTYNISISTTGGSTYRSMVRWIQCSLCVCGYTTAIDGVFGSNTSAAVKSFQRDHGLSADGIVGTLTRNELSKAVSTAVRYDYYYETLQTTTNYTYYYYKVDSDWSEWQEDAIAGDTQINAGTTKVLVESKMQYRVKEAEVNDNGTLYTPKCVLPESAKNLAGKDAVVIVFKNKVNQIAEDNVEYIGNTSIEADGSINISFVPREELSYEGTGDYTIVLGVKGTTNYVKVGTIEAPKPVYKVSFVDADGNVIKSEDVVEGHDATVPEAPFREGYIFTGWDTGVTNIHSDLTITAQYEAAKCMVTYVDWINKNIETKEVEYGSFITYPEEPKVTEGLVFEEWSIKAGTRITENTVCEAIYKTATCNVKFVDDEGNEIYTAEVPYGDSVVAPAVVSKEDDVEIEDSIEEEKDGKQFVSWGEDIDLSCVTTNLLVGAIYRYLETTQCPSVTVMSGEYTESQKVEFVFDDDQDGIVYYTLDGSDPTDIENTSVKKYSEPVTISSTCELTYYATSMGKNDSPIGKEYYAINKAGNAPKHIVNIIPVNEFDNTVIAESTAFVADGSKLNVYDLICNDFTSVELEGIYYDKEMTDRWQEGVETVTEGLTLFARYVAKKYTVTYLDENGNVITTGKIAYGEPVDASVAPEKAGYRFAGWESEDDVNAVTKDMIVQARYVSSEEYVIIKFGRSIYSIMEGSAYKLTPKVKYEASGNVANNEIIEWSVSDEKYATIDDNGVVTALMVGEVTVTAKVLSSGETASCTVKITANPENSICLYSNSTYSIEDGYLRNISLGNNTVDEVKKQINATELKFIDMDGLALTDLEYVGTGTRVQLVEEDGTVLDEVIVIITGDYNGDGFVNGRDVSGLSRALLKKEVATQVQLMALDLNGDGYVNNRDAAMLARYLVGKEKL